MANYFDFKKLIYPQGYVNKLDDSILDGYFLVNGSKNVFINDEGRIAKRKGFTIYGEADPSGTGIDKSYSWKTNSNEILVRTIYDKLQAYYQGSWKDILTGIKSKTKFRFTTWWNKTEIRDILITCNGEPDFYTWIGGMTEVASVTSNSITKKYALQTAFTFTASDRTITTGGGDFLALGFKAGDYISVRGSASNDGRYKVGSVETGKITLVTQDIIIDETSPATTIVGVLGRETWREERFFQQSGKKLLINGTEYTYTAGWDTPTLTISSNPVGSVNADDFVSQVVETEAIVTRGDVPAEFPIDIVETHLNQIIIASETHRLVFMAKQEDYLDFSYNVTVRKVAEGATASLDANVKAVTADHENIYVSCGQNDIYRLWLEPYEQASSQGEILRVKKLKTATGQGAVSHEGFITIKNGLLFVSNEPAIDFLGNVELVQGVQTKPISDDIKRLLYSLDRTDVSGLYFQNYAIFLFPHSYTMLFYDFTRQIWQPPQTISASSMDIHENQLIIHSNTHNESYVFLEGHSDDGAPISAEIYTNADNMGRTRNLVYDELYIEIIVNSEVENLELLTILGYNGADGERVFSVSYDEKNKNAIQQVITAGNIGGVPFGNAPVGSLGGDQNNLAETENLRMIRKIYTLNKGETYLTQLGLREDRANSYFELLCWGVNLREPEANLGDIKVI